MNETERTDPEIQRLMEIVRIQAKIIKRQAVIDAIDKYQAHAQKNALSIASECAALIQWFGAPKSNSPFTDEYMALREKADKLMREVLP
jgi:hypothetical protein